jgi:hypothetical protein
MLRRVLGVALGCQIAFAQTQFEFFEKRVRPVLAEKCYACHGSMLATSGLRLDTREGMLRGGSRGAVLVAGHPESSLIVKAISHEDAHLKMPPAGKLPPEQIADLAEWIRLGAADPRVDAAASAGSIDLAEGRRYWAFQPLARTRPPAMRNRAWVRTPVDAFLLAAMEAKGVRAAPQADRRTLIRRVTYDLTGLPPTPAEVDAFLGDRSPNAFAKVVERLLASPHYGERWGRHWLDLVRFGETTGHEFDSDKPDAWRYRDYVIRAFNEDLPYDRFVREHIAGDLLPDSRRSAGGMHHESILGTGFFGLHEERNAADDLAEVQAENVDNQIDVLSKTFLGLTVACARCHDHKFDPIPTSDYYALAGVLHSTRQYEGDLSTPALRQEIDSGRRALASARAAAAALLEPARRVAAASLKASLLAPDEAWKKTLERARREPDHILYPFAVLSRPSETPFAERLAKIRAELEARREWLRPGDVVFADFASGTYDGWQRQGAAFGEAPSAAIPPNQPLAGHQGGAIANSFGPGSDELTGVLVSRTFLANRRFLHVRMSGTVDKTRRREHGVLRFTVQVAGRPAFVNVDAEGVFEWKTVGLRLAEGQHCHLVIADRARDGHIAVDKIVLSDENRPPALPANPRVVALLARHEIDSLERLAEGYERIVLEALAEPMPDAEVRWLLGAIEPTGKLESLAPSLDEAGRKSLAAIAAERLAIAARIPSPAYGLVSGEGAVRDVPVLMRGNLASPGPVAPRGFLQVLARGGSKYSEGSGRAELARDLSAADNALVARVMVNRIWKHHFGEGLVRTVDNFGRTGDRPSHPELLDWLAARFVASGWSVKSMHRLILASAAWSMSSRPLTASARIDPENRLVHHMPVRRLEAESVRDAVLAVAGTLDRTVYGPSVRPFISAYQDGRGKPQPPGPLDGAGRRSIYIEVRRNFLTPLLLAFDYPLPVTTIGRRGVTTVPSQALMLMNNEFIAGQARKWAERITAAGGDARARIARMFVEAYGRPPEAAESARIEQFLREQSALHGGAQGEASAWADVAHVLINAKEFIFVR